MAIPCGGGGGGYVEQPRLQGCFVTKPKVFCSDTRAFWIKKMFLSLELQVSFVVLEFSFSFLHLLFLKVLCGNDHSNNDWSS